MAAPRDITICVRPGTPEWPGDTPYSCTWTARIADGSSVNLTTLGGSPHVGTHADAPLHVKDGAPASHELPLSAFRGRAVVVTVSGDDVDVTIDQIEKRAPRRRIERLLLRSGQSIAGGSFPASWPALTQDCALALIDRGLKLLGVDAPSVDQRESKTLTIHHTLFSHGAYVLENLDLRDVPDGEYELVALPMRLEGLDAAPVRALLEPI